MKNFLIMFLVAVALVLNFAPENAIAEEELKEVVLSVNDFENADFCSCIDGAQTGYENPSIYTGGDLTFDGFDFNVTQNNAAVVATVADPEEGGSRGKVLMIEGNEEYGLGTVHPTYISYNGEKYMPLKKSYSFAPKQRIVIEFDMYVSEKRPKSGNFTLRSTLWGYPTSRTDEVHFFSLSNSGSLTTIKGDFSWQEKTWHKIRAYMDMDEKLMDLSADGNMIVEDYAFTAADIFDSTGVATIKYAFAFNGGIQKIYLDNIKVSVMIVPPKISELSFSGKSGEISESAKGYDTSALKLRCSEEILKTSVENNISLEWKRKNETVAIPFELSFAKDSATEFALNLKAPLRENETYVLKVGEGFESLGGNINPSSQSFEFKTLPAAVYVKSLDVTDSSASAVFVNSTEQEINLKAVVAGFENGNLKYMHYTNLTAPVGETVLTADIPSNIGSDVRVYVCNDRFVPYYIDE